LRTKLGIKLGLQIPLFDFPGVAPGELFERVSDIARTAEASGFDSVWVMDHFEQIMGDPAAPILEGYIVLAGIAARTERVNLGTLVTGVLYRNPAVLAKMVTSLDVLSSGRAVLGIGASWNESEQQHYGIERVTVAERMDRLDEALEICRLMFTQDAPSFKGRYYEINEARNVPRPVRGDGVPEHVPRAPIARDRTQRALLAATADHDRAAVRTHRPRHVVRLVDLVVAALKRRRILREHQPADLESFVEAIHPFVDGHALDAVVLLLVLVPGCTDAEHGAAA